MLHFGAFQLAKTWGQLWNIELPHKTLYEYLIEQNTLTPSVCKDGIFPSKYSLINFLLPIFDGSSEIDKSDSRRPLKTAAVSFSLISDDSPCL